MADSDKTELLVFARAFQNAYRIAALYGSDHASSKGAVVHAYSQLANLLKQQPKIAIGFLNGRAMLNAVVSKEHSLASLEAEFDKRGIGLIRFSAGMSLENFQRLLAVATAKKAAIEESGGIEAFVANHPVELGNIIPASRFLMQPDESWLDMGADPAGSAPRSAGLQGLDMLLQSSSKEGSLNLQASDVLSLINNAIHNALSDSAGIPAQAVTAIARILGEMNRDYVLIALPPDRQQALAGKSNQEIASEIAEDFAAKWAVTQVAAAPDLPGEALERVAAGLAQAMKVTDGKRLKEKIERAMTDQGIPSETMDRVQREMGWASMPAAEKAAVLMKLEKYNDEDFQRMQTLISSLVSAGTYSQAGELLARYFAVCEIQGLSEGNLALGADLICLFSGQSGLEILRSLLPRLRPRLTDASLAPESHREIANCLVSIARTAAGLEDFETVTAIGKDLEASASSDRAAHGICCAAAAGTLMSQTEAERVLELFMKKRDDAAFSRMVPALLRYAGTAGAEVALSRLETEESGQNRKVLMRLIAQLGTSALDAARLRVKSGTWYIVRNVCTVLQELHDPDLAQDLRPGLVHDDPRVQQAAFNAVTKGRAAGRAEVIANCLISFHPHVLELALDEITFLKDPKSLAGLNFFVSNTGGKSAAIVQKAIAALRAIGGDQAMVGLGRILKDPSAPLPARKTAMEALRWSMLPAAKAQLDEFATSPDPLAREYLAKATGR